MSPDGGAPEQLTFDASPDSDPRWSPDGSRLAFDSRREDGERNIWVLEADGSTFTPLTQDSGISNAFATWSPDGIHIAWARDSEIWIMNSADGKDPHRLTSGGRDSAPTWSSTGVIAFQRTINGSLEIWTIPADGSADATPLLDAAQGGGGQPSWSPNGKRIAYSKVVDGVRRIWVANADARSGRKNLTPGSGCPCEFPTWSPDGTQIAFEVSIPNKEQIAIVPAAGGTIRVITSGNSRNFVPGWAT